MNTVTEIESAKATLAAARLRAEYVAQHPATPALYVPTTSGLWAHSHDAAHDLMKPFLVERYLYTPDGKADGFNALASFNTWGEAFADAQRRSDVDGNHRVRDNSGKWGDGK